MKTCADTVIFPVYAEKMNGLTDTLPTLFSASGKALYKPADIKELQRRRPAGRADRDQLVFTSLQTESLSRC